jgi:molybdate transport system substrate-binding protein
MDQVIAAKDATASKVFAKNIPEIAVPPSNPAHLTTVADLAKPGVKVALCAPTVPLGALAQQMFTKAGVNVKPATIEPDVKATLAKVELGEVDAGIVYVTDVRAAGTKVTGIPIPTNLSGSTNPIATLTRHENTALATAILVPPEPLLITPGSVRDSRSFPSRVSGGRRGPFRRGCQGRAA